MRHFMAGFFIVFAFFKLLNIQGFADSYRMYDIVAAKWPGWGYVYPFVELALGGTLFDRRFSILDKCSDDHCARREQYWGHPEQFE